jgi:hypothetical protein
LRELCAVLDTTRQSVTKHLAVLEVTFEIEPAGSAVKLTVTMGRWPMPGAVTRRSERSRPRSVSESNSVAAGRAAG